MREITKSTLRLPWALSLLGLSQLVELADPKRGRPPTRETMEAFRELAERGMDDPIGQWFQAGDRLQSGLVDALFDLASNNPLGRSATQRARETIESSWQALRQGLSNDPAD